MVKTKHDKTDGLLGSLQKKMVVIICTLLIIVLTSCCDFGG